MSFRLEPGRKLLMYDVPIEKAAREGDNDMAYELSIRQKDYYENFNTNEGHAEEWRLRKEEWKALREGAAVDPYTGF